MAGAFASNGMPDWDETSFLGVDDGPFGRPLTVHKKTSKTAALAPTLAHSSVRRHVTRRW
jgi:hypothetical protein